MVLPSFITHGAPLRELRARRLRYKRSSKLNTACAKMFADDTNITISGSSQADLEQETNSELLNLHCWIKANKLNLNVAKTEFI